MAAGTPPEVREEFVIFNRLARRRALQGMLDVLTIAIDNIRQTRLADLYRRRQKALTALQRRGELVPDLELEMVGVVRRVWSWWTPITGSGGDHYCFTHHRFDKSTG